MNERKTAHSVTLQLYLQNLLDPESFTRMMQVLTSPTPVGRNNSIAKKIMRAIFNEEFVLNEKTKRY